MKKLYCLLLLIACLNSFAKNEVVAGPAIGVTMRLPHALPGFDLWFNITIKNTGDQALTNIFLTDVTNNPLVQWPIQFYLQDRNTIFTYTSLAPGESINLSGKGRTSMCYIYSSIKVHAMTPANIEITDLSHEYDMYLDGPTPTEIMFFNTIEADGIYNDFNQNSILDVGDVINYTYNGFSYEPFVFSDSNATIVNPNVPGYNNWSTTGIHYITQAEIDLGYVYNNITITNSNSPCNQFSVQDPTPCNNCPRPNNCNQMCFITKIGSLLPNQISGTVKYNTANDNCVSGLAFRDRNVNTTDGTTTYGTYSSANGAYKIYIPNTGNFTTTANLNGNFSSNPASVATVSSGQNNNYNADFCIGSATNFTDLNVVLCPLDHPRPGFDSQYRLVYTNYGSTNLNGSIQLTFDNSKISLLSANPVQNNLTSNVITWNYTNLLPFEKRYINISFNTFAPPVANDGDALTFTTVANPIAGDNFPTNNTFVLNQNFVNAFDPNDKTVLEGATIPEAQVGNYLHYVTRFQNTGSAAATTVVIKETLDADLDWTTFEPLAASHDYNIQVKNGNALTYTFSNIGLINSSANEAQSHGFMAYKIKPKAGFTFGDVASSKSDIYFDYNPPIITNNVNTELSTLQTSNFSSETLNIYPNPASDRIYISDRSLQNADYQIADISGKIIAKGKFTGEYIPVNQFEKGIYFLKISNRKTAKIIIE